MKLSNIVGATLIGATLTTAGCNRSEELREKEHIEQVRKESEERQEEWKKIAEIQAHIKSALVQGKKESYSLEHFRDKISGIHLFDGNKNSILELEEIDLFIKVVINKNSETYTKEGLKKLQEIRMSIEKDGNREYQFRPLNFGSDVRWSGAELDYRTRIEVERHQYTPDNITQTLKNMSIKCREYEEKLREQIESEIQKQINQALKK